MYAVRFLKSFYYSSLFQKVPKKYAIPINNSWVSRIFERSKNSQSYVLLTQLFEYLKNSNLFKQQFPFLQNDERFKQNSMALHTVLLKNRLKSEQQISSKELQFFNYNCQVYFFPDYAKNLHSNIPTDNFSVHFSESYFKRLELYESVIAQEEQDYHLVNFNQAIPRYSYIFGKIIYESRLKPEDNELKKYSEYYLAHRKYLWMLSYQNLIQYQIKWGFNNPIRFLETNI